MVGAGPSPLRLCLSRASGCFGDLEGGPGCGVRCSCGVRFRDFLWLRDALRLRGAFGCRVRLCLVGPRFAAERILRPVAGCGRLQNAALQGDAFIQMVKEQNSPNNPPPQPQAQEQRAQETKSLLEENKRLKEERICKICMDEEVSVVFLPCGHLVACVLCADALRNCAICRTAIEGKVRTTLSAESSLDAVMNIEDKMTRQTAQGTAMAVIPQEESGQQPLVPALAEVPASEETQKTSQTQNSEKQSKKDNKKKKKKQDAPVPKESDDKE